MYDPNPSEFSDSDIRLVAALIHAEGPGSSYIGYRALASIVYNRVKNKSGKFPNSVPGVIFQSGQFGYSRAYLNSITPNSKAMAAAKYVFLQHGSTLPKKFCFIAPHISARNGRITQNITQRLKVTAISTALSIFNT